MEEDELQQLLCDIADMDPDNTMLPAGYRQLRLKFKKFENFEILPRKFLTQTKRDQTTKDPTGELDRDKLMSSLEETALEIPDKEEEVPFVAGTKKGKVFKQKEKIQSDNPYA